MIIGGKEKEKEKSPVEKEKRSIVISDKKWSITAEKEKLATERGKLNKDNELRHGKIKTLITELESLKVQQTELTKSNDSKGDFASASNQILAENSKLQEEIQEEIEKLQREQKQTNEAIEEILNKELKLTEKKVAPEKTEAIKEKDQKNVPEKKPEPKSVVIKPTDKVKVGDGSKQPESSKQSDGSKQSDSSKQPDSSKQTDDSKQKMKYYFTDRGCHWCKGCKDVYENIHDYIAHLQTYKHKQTMPVDLKPWKDGFQPNEGKIVNKKAVQISLPGTEFLIPSQAFYCQICRIFLGDVSCAIDHFRCESHFTKYQVTHGSRLR